MIIISDKPGQFANLLFIYANLLAYGKENKVRVVNPAFHQYRAYFPATAGFSFTGNGLIYKICNLVSRTLNRARIKKGPVRCIALDWHQQINLENAPQLKGGVCFVKGWLFRSEHLLVKHSEGIKQFFTPGPGYTKIIDEFFRSAVTRPDTTVIGIHVRRGDYKHFENGRYYYSIEEYQAIIAQLFNLFKSTNPVFVVCSNENTGLESQAPEGAKIIAAPGHELLDLYTLSRCNYIAGPPSTYSMWASYYGDVPLCMIQKSDQKIDKNDFKIHLA